MNIFFAGGEDSGLLSVAYGSISTSTGFASGFARSAIEFTSTATSIVIGSFNASSGTVWVHANIFFSGALNWISAQPIFTFTDGSGHTVSVVTNPSNSGQVTVQKSNGSGTTATLYTSSPGALVSAVSPQPIDIFLNYATSGQLSIYQNGVLAADTGPGVNMLYTGSASIAKFAFGGVGSSPNIYISEIVIADSSTLGLRVVTLPPAAAGNTQSWTPSTLANINKTTINDSTFISTASNNVLSEWTTSSIGISGSYSVIALVEEVRAEVGSTGPQHFSWVTRVSGTDYTQGTIAVSTSFTNYNGGENGGVWYSNPASGASWAISDFNAVGFNIGIESLA